MVLHRGKIDDWKLMSRPTKVSHDSFVFNQDLSISNKGFMENQHSKSITKLKFELQLHIALQQDILSESAFYTKKTAMPIIFYTTPCGPL